MAAIPLLEEVSSASSGAMVAELAGLTRAPIERSRLELLRNHRTSRRLSIYDATAGFDLVEELDYLCTRTVEPNVFFNPRFLGPAMPRLEDREVRLAIMRDGDDDRDRVRLLAPFSVEPSPVRLGPSIMRIWANAFGPLGTPLLDKDDPESVLEDFFSMLARPHLGLPRVMVFPEIKLDGVFAAILRNVADTRGQPWETLGMVERPVLKSALDGEAYLKQSLRSHHYREFRRLRRRLEDNGPVEHLAARNAAEIRLAAEDFLALEASGWKGRERTAMAVDRYRSAFAREAIHRLAEQDMCRIHSLTLNGQTIASLIVFIEAGVAYTWKTAFNEKFSAWSPGTLLMIEVTKQHLDDPNIEVSDSCAVPNHPVMSRLWSERQTIGTIVVGLTPQTDRATRQVASQMHLYRETRNFARLVRDRVRNIIRR